MSLLQNTTIKTKLVLIIMVTCLVALLFAGVGFISWSQYNFRKTMAKNIVIHAKIIADNCKAALTFEDAGQATETLKALHVEHSMIAGCVYDKSGRLFANYHRRDMTARMLPQEIMEDGYYFDKEFLTVFQTIILDDEIIGTVSLRSDLSSLHAVFRRNLSIMFSVILAASVAAYFMSSRLQKIISSPILGLAKIAKTVSENKDYSIRSIKHGNDEVGLLIDSFNEMLEHIQHRDLELVYAKSELEKRVRERTAELTGMNKQLKTEIDERKQAEVRLKETYAKLVVTSRHAGMAEVASGVLHNVGNVLNSVNVSTTLIMDKIAGSRIPHLTELAAIINEHSDNMTEFLTEDERGQCIPLYLTEVAKLLTHEWEEISGELSSLVRNVEHIKDIISTQQAFARTTDIESDVSVKEIAENAIQVDITSLKKHGIAIEYDLSEIARISIDKQRVLQILVNLISNAKHSLNISKKTDKLLTIRSYRHNEDRVRIEVIDNGVGIARDKLTDIFRHGFTTREDGHGFGLHSSALSARQLGGSLVADSDGPEKGAKFILELPFRPVEAKK